MDNFEPQQKEQRTGQQEAASTATLLSEFVMRNMDRIDSDKSERLSKSELQTAKQSQNWSTKDAETIDTLLTNFDTLKKVGSYKSSYSELYLTAQVTVRDVLLFEKQRGELKEERKNVQHALKFANDNFSSIDQDKNGFLNIPELVASRKMAPQHIDTLISRFPKMQNASWDEFISENDGITKKDIESYPKTWQRETDHVEDTRCGCSTCKGGKPDKGAILSVLDKDSLTSTVTSEASSAKAAEKIALTVQRTSAEITAPEVANFILNNMSSLDANGSGRLSKAELKLSREKGNWTPRETKIIEQIEANYSTMSRAVLRSGLKSSLSTSFTTEISARDVVRFNEMHGELKQELKAVTNALEFGKQNFETVDKNKNGYLSLSELTNSRTLSPKEIGQLIKKLPQIQSASNDELDFETNGISKEDLSNYPARWSKEDINMKDARYHYYSYRQPKSANLISKGSVLEVAK